VDARLLRCVFLPFALVFAAGIRPAAAQSKPLIEVLHDVGQYVSSYLTRVQSVVGTERVVVQPIARDWTSEGRPRTLVFELRLDWTPGAEAAVRRDLVRVNGRAPRPRDEPLCMDSAAITPEPLEFLLPDNQEKVVFTDAGFSSMDGRRVRVLGYRSRAIQPVKATWKEGCGSVDPGREIGRLWVDAETAEVRRVDSGFSGLIELRVPRDQPWPSERRDLTFERSETSIRYRPVRFDDPQETLLLPAAVDSITIIRNAVSLRVRHEYSGYRRFVTGGRVVQ
jgi:hypothetical protein